MPNTSGAPLEADTLPDNAPDLDCFRKAQSGDRAAYGRIVMTYQDRLYNALLRLVGNPDEARDLTQETFTRGLTKIDTFRGQSSPYTWLFRIGMNLALTQLRKTSRHRSFSLDPHNGDGLPSIDGQAATLMHRFASARESSPRNNSNAANASSRFSPPWAGSIPTSAPCWSCATSTVLTTSRSPPSSTCPSARSRAACSVPAWR